MSAYTFTASAVRGTFGGSRISGEAINAGQLIAIVGGLAMVADKDSAALADVAGVALNTVAAAGQCVLFATAGEVTVQAATFGAVAQPLIVGNAGQTRDAGDLTTGEYLTSVGWSTAANKFRLSRVASGLAVA